MSFYNPYRSSTTRSDQSFLTYTSPSPPSPSYYSTIFPSLSSFPSVASIPPISPIISNITDDPINTNQISTPVLIPEILTYVSFSKFLDKTFYKGFERFVKRLLVGEESYSPTPSEYLETLEPDDELWYDHETGDGYFKSDVEAEKEKERGVMVEDEGYMGVGTKRDWSDIFETPSIMLSSNPISTTFTPHKPSPNPLLEAAIQHAQSQLDTLTAEKHDLRLFQSEVKRMSESIMTDQEQDQDQDGRYVVDEVELQLLEERIKELEERASPLKNELQAAISKRYDLEMGVREIAVDRKGRRSRLGLLRV